ncbi:MAG: nickel pincer cofactor biosynthesis protein LarB [Candidatus Methanoperedens sp.]|nr:nickel pincer cofactor biosynthesis protein LarB [Candidatus Methanoperedens sp.]MCZ7360392.1 nickel pincer cofactor biosynthesis protein LarB [Candidatus Methanoperedens sp.]HLB70605.1 nickel pincer cofactor biosynthesis protein LarB [Candidatus Methanoperedens sp.]
MDLSDILKKLKNNEIGLAEAERCLRITNFEILSNIAKIDIHRTKRTGIPEAIIADCKTCDEVVSIARVHLKNEGRVMVTRASGENYRALSSLAEEMGADIRCSRASGVVAIGEPVARTGGKVGIISAGTADIPVAEEARATAEEMGCGVTTIYDVGVAGIHRLFPELTKLIEAGVDAVVVAAGREGTLPAVVAGLVDAPVIGVPVSTGYGAGGKGEAALLSMLQSCSVLTVVNIDAGFVAGAFAARIANLAAKHRNQRS